MLTLAQHRVCAHEAGHTVVALVAGFGVQGVSVDLAQACGVTTSQVVWKSDHDAALDLVWAMSGLMGEALAGFAMATKGAHDDLRRLTWLLGRSSWARLPRESVQHTFLTLAGHILGANRSLFDALRTTLATQPILTGSQVWDVAMPHVPLQRPWGEDWQRALTDAYRGG